jgi:phosphotransferase family enzyme
MVVAKTYRGEKGANAFAGMQALWDAPVASGAVVSLAEPIAYREDLRLLVQGPVAEERTLKDLVRSTFAAGEDERVAVLEAVGAELAKAADGLAALHDSGIEHGEVVTWEEELGDVRNLIARLRGPLPEAAGAVSTFLDGLEVRSRRSAAEPLAPCHRSFRPAQVLLHQGRIAFIDFDGLAMAEPALDVALFRAAVRDVGAGALLGSGAPRPEVDRALDALDALCDGFLARYRAHRPVSPERVVLWETLDLVTYVLHCWTKIKPERLVTRMTLLDRHIATAALG